MVVFRSEPFPKVEAIPSPGLSGQRAEQVRIDRNLKRKVMTAKSTGCEIDRGCKKVVLG